MTNLIFFGVEHGGAFYDDALDRLPDDQRHPVAKRVEAGAYKRYFSGGRGGIRREWNGPGERVALPSNAADFKPSELGPGKLP
jgi:hypothetical protein